MGILDGRAGLAGKLAVVVGGGGGIGGAIASDLAAAGVHLALCDKDEDRLAETASAARRAGVEVITAGFDARVPDALEQFFAMADEAFTMPVGILVNVVGGAWRQPFLDSKPSGWSTLVRTNLTWLLYATQLAGQRMRASGEGGSIINFSSIEGHRASPGLAVYGAIKGAIAHLTRSLAVELGEYGIRVNDVASDAIPPPGGWGDARDAAGVAGSQARAEMSIPLRRRGDHEDISNCVLFLASSLSRYVTGTTLHPDGGTLAQAGWERWPGTGFFAGPPPALGDLFARLQSEAESAIE